MKALVESGRLLDAQKLILAEVESQVGGNAEAFGKTLPGALGRLDNSIRELVAGGIEPMLGGLTDGANGLAAFFTNLQDSGEASNAMAEGMAAVKAAVEPLFNAIQSEGPRIKSIFDNLKDSAHDLLPAVKLVAAIVGITLVVAFKIAIRVIENMVRIWQVTGKVISTLTRIIVAAVDGILGGFQALAEGASHIPVIGDQFKGVAEAIGSAREDLRGLTDDLDSLDGKQVRVDVQITASEKGAVGLGLGGDRTRSGPPTGRSTGGAGTSSGGATEIGPRQAQEIALQNSLDLANSTRQTTVDDKAALNALIRFYGESIRIAKARGVGTKQFLAAQNNLRNQLADLGQQAADDAKAAAEDAKQVAAERVAATQAEHLSTLQANITIAGLTKNIIRDDVVAYKAFIRFLKDRVSAAKQAGVGIAAARAELKQAQTDLATIRKDAIRNRIDERESLLQDRLTLAGFTPKESDDKKAYRALIAFYKARVRDLRLTRAERRKYRIALEQTKRDLREMNKGDGKTAGKQEATTAFDLLQQNVGTFGSAAGNLINADQPFKEASDFTAQQAAQLTRRTSGEAAKIALVTGETKRERATALNTTALDRNTAALLRGREEGTEGPRRGRPKVRSGAVPPHDARWKEAHRNRATVEAR